MNDRIAVTAGPEAGEIYLDNNATTRPLPEVIEAVSRAMVEGSGNASSVHSTGGRARQLLQDARMEVAQTLSAQPDWVVFTSGATEANNLVLQGLLGVDRGVRRLVTTKVEHSSILATAEYLEGKGVDVVFLPVDRRGLVDPERVRDAVLPGETLVSIQWANNETGVIQDISRLVQVVSRAGGLFHTDAVQAVGKLKIDLAEVPVDFLSLSAHKLHGPLGVGALVGPNVEEVRPLVYGGSQEVGLRPGTENVPAIMGLTAALRARRERFDAVADSTREVRDHLETSLLERGLVAAVNGATAARLPNTSNMQFAGIDGEALTIRLDQLGVRCSQSSACTNQKPEPSYVLRAMGLTEDEAFASVRFGVSELTTRDEVDVAIDRISSIHASLRRFAVA